MSELSDIQNCISVKWLPEKEQEKEKKISQWRKREHKYGLQNARAGL